MKHISRITTLLSIWLFLFFILLKLTSLHLTAQANDLQAEVDYLQGVVSEQSEAMAALAERQTSLEAKVVLLTHELSSRELTHDSVSRGDVEPVERVLPVTFEVTAYDLSVESCGKKPSHPEYGVGASGKRVQEWHSIAMGKAYPFGTRVFIPFFADKSNDGIFVCEDRGGAIHDDCIDVYMPDNAECMQFGRQMLECYVLD